MDVLYHPAAWRPPRQGIVITLLPLFCLLNTHHPGCGYGGEMICSSSPTWVHMGRKISCSPGNTKGGAGWRTCRSWFWVVVQACHTAMFPSVHNASFMSSPGRFDLFVKSRSSRSAGEYQLEAFRRWSFERPLEAPFKPPWSPLQAPFKPLEAPFTFGRLQAPFKPPSSPLEAPFKRPWSLPKVKPPWSPLEAPLKPSEGEAPFDLQTFVPPPPFAPRPFKPPWRGLLKGVPRNQPRNDAWRKQLGGFLVCLVSSIMDALGSRGH